MDLCFVIMPYTVKPDTADQYPLNHWDEVFDKLIKPAVEEAGLECRREDKELATTMILPDILKNIEVAKLLLCDLSTNNPNVLLELGWGLRAGRPVVLIRDKRTAATFNLVHVTTLDYSLEPETLPGTIHKIAERIAATLKAPKKLQPLPGVAQGATARPAAVLGGIKAFYPSRSLLGRGWWEQFYSPDKNAKNILLMGQSISKAFTNERQASTFVKWCNNGAAMRVLLLSPENAEALQLQSVGGGMKVPAGASGLDPSDYLKAKIYNTIESLSRGVIAKIPAPENKPMVRFATRDMPFSIMAVDGDMVVTFYGADPEADNQPTLFIRGEQDPAYCAFKTEFDRIWDEYSKVVPYEDPLLASCRRQWNKYVGLRNHDTPLGPPMQAVIYPTYRCSAGCPYCMYRSKRASGTPAEMAPGDFSRIFQQLFDGGVRRFEISGGGEPLEHKAADDLVACLQRFVETHPGLSIGLLTNGMHIPGQGARLLDAFNGYIRVSRYDRLSSLESSDYADGWRRGIKELLAAKRRRQTTGAKIGIKYLLTPENASEFVGMVREDLADEDLLGVDHYRFRSDRRTDPATITRIEQQLYYLLDEVGLITMSDRVSLSLPNFVYPRNFHCWISPMNVVIAPDQDVYLCCNYTRHRNHKCLGNLAQTSFADLWNNQKHRELRHVLTKAHCDWQGYCNCRYAEIQNMFERIAFVVGAQKTKGAV